MATVQTYLSDILHVVSQGLLAPDIILLLLFIGYALFCIGSLLVETFTERKHYKVVMPRFLSDLTAAEEKDIPSVVEQSGLLNRQKEALMTVYEYRTLPGDALMALIKRLMEEEEARYDSITGRNNTAARVAPMLGLMGTLIPLGPGIEALGRADTATLSSSLLVAFDTTVAGLVVAAVCLVIGKIRSVWYDNYMSALEASMATMLEKIENERRGSREVVLNIDGQEYKLVPTAAAVEEPMVVSEAVAEVAAIVDQDEQTSLTDDMQVEADDGEGVFPRIDEFIEQESDDSTGQHPEEEPATFDASEFKTEELEPIVIEQPAVEPDAFESAETVGHDSESGSAQSLMFAPSKDPLAGDEETR